jgi:hypothetical protein
MVMSRRILSAILMLILVGSFGCGDGDNGGNPSPSKVVVTLEPATFAQGVGLTNTFTATVTGTTDTAVTWYVNNIPGGDSTTVGKITDAGVYRAPDDVPVPAIVVVKAKSVEDPRSYDTAELTIVSGNGTGLPATYSTGPQLLEGPIFHGWWWDCTGTNYNWYEGECTAVDASPVDWADGMGWSVTWTGQLFVPVSGDYRFASRYWVDGIVYINVNGTIVADLNTTGAGYSQTVTLQGNTWVPIQMSFQPNGGSNNMHLAWVSPGGEWRPVARSYLKP